MTVLQRSQFTQRELQVLDRAQSGHALYDKRLFNKLEQIGVLKNDRMTGCRVRCFYGYGWSTIKYIDSCERFEVEGIPRSFGRRYYDGCFNPYMVKN